jgi:hypothetical protein
VIGCRAFVFLVPLALTGACARQSGALSPRESLRQALLAQHDAELARDSAAVAEKLRRMARGNFAFFRGSLGLHPPAASNFSAAAPVAVFGDPHPENIGTFALPGDQSGDETIVDFNDFDQAGFGAFVEDLRRLCLGLYLAGDAADVPKKHRARFVEAAINGYLAELRALARGEPPVALRGSTAFAGGLGPILDDPTLTVVEPVGRSGINGGHGGSLGEGLLSGEERETLAAALVRARATMSVVDRSPAFFAVKRAARHRGGIASLFVERIRAQIEGPTSADDDDQLLELKETPGNRATVIVRLQRELQERPDEDSLLGIAEVFGKTYRLRSLGAKFRSISVERISDEMKGPGWGKRDFRSFAFDNGRLLARGHARAKGPSGETGLASLTLVVGDGKALRRETLAATQVAADRLESNVDDLRRLLADHGPVLGWKTPAATLVPPP